MILFDISNVIHSNVHQLYKNLTPDDSPKDLLRHMVLNSVRNIYSMFKKEYGQMFICMDSKNSWRYEIFPQYKQQRKEQRVDSNIDYKMVSELYKELGTDLHHYFPFHVLIADKAEADDLIAIVCNKMKDTNEKILIVSGDKDFICLQVNKNVKQYAPVKKEFVSHENPENYLMELIVRGDAADGIPNIFSPIDVFQQKGVRQKSVRTKDIEKWIECAKQNSFEEPDVQERFLLNKTLIAFEDIPQNIQEKVVELFDKYKDEKKKYQQNKLIEYCVKHRLKMFLDSIEELG